MVFGSGVLAAQESRLPVRLEDIPEGPHYVGQAIPVRLLVTAEEETPLIDLPDVAQVDLFLVGSDVRPITAGSIGAMVHETNLYRFELLLIPRTSGSVIVPAFRARVGDRHGVSKPIRLNAVSPPAFGRPPWFLGGIGPIELEWATQAGAIRLGESFLISVRMKGDGALGSTVRPRLRGSDGGTLPAAVEPEASRLDLSPPTRTVSYRVRPTEAGTLKLAPVLVAWFNPETRRYQTVSTEGVSLRVADPPRFDPGMIEVAHFDEEPQASQGDWNWLLNAIGITGVGTIVMGVLWRTVRRWHRSPNRMAVRAARAMRSMEGLARADFAAASLVAYLHLATGRPEGVLTPPEAHEAIATLTDDLSLADRVKTMMETSDAMRYSGRSSDDETQRSLLEDAPAIFRALARVRLNASRTDTGRSGTDDPESSVSS
ncbi:BatD family protein [Tautonia rosea]|uniref:BatD family protein n=1 Tax=Tautonia rosea TaxID=2728037 RepID=UPI001474224E|nr:BatD family protein [Tautonia rosea]